MIGPTSRKNKTSHGDSVPNTDSGTLFLLPHNCIIWHYRRSTNFSQTDARRGAAFNETQQNDWCQQWNESATFLKLLCFCVPVLFCALLVIFVTIISYHGRPGQHDGLFLSGNPPILYIYIYMYIFIMANKLCCCCCWWSRTPTLGSLHSTCWSLLVQVSVLGALRVGFSRQV